MTLREPYKNSTKSEASDNITVMSERLLDTDYTLSYFVINSRLRWCININKESSSHNRYFNSYLEADIHFTFLLNYLKTNKKEL